MDGGSDYSRNRNNDHLGINKIGKNIRKSPLHQPNFNNSSRPQPQPQVYNINKNDFRNIVQQLTGSPSQEPLPRPSQNPPRPPSMRLQKIRPPPLTPINRSQIPIHHPAPPPHPQPPPRAAVAPPPFGNNNFARPAQFGQPSPPPMWRQLAPADSGWANTAESPISAYMRYLQNSMNGSPQPPMSSGLLPNPSVPPLPSPRMNGAPLPSPRMNGPPFPSQQMNGPPLPSLRMNGPPVPSPGNGPPFRSQQMNGPPFPPPQTNGPPLLPSPTSQFLLPSPTGFFNMLSPRSPYPLLSPGYQFPPPMTPNFSFSPMSGILGPGPPSPGIGFPLSPSGFYPFPSPRWGDQ